MQEEIVIESSQTVEAQAGNNNALVGARHKAQIGARFNDPTDQLARRIAQMAGIADLADSCFLRSKEAAGLAESGSEVGMLAIGSDGLEAEIEVAAKTCGGLGSSNQTARFWAKELLTQAEISAPIGAAFLALCGSLSSDGESQPHSTPGHLVSTDFKKTGKPLQLWLGDPANLARVANKALGVEQGTPRGRKLMLFTLREAGPDNDDLHLLVDRVDMRDHIVANSAKNNNGVPFLPVGVSDNAIEFSKFLNLKRKGGDSGERQSDQLQAAVSPRELLAAVLSGDLPGYALREEPTPESRAIQELSLNGREAREAKPKISAFDRLVKMKAKLLADESVVKPFAKMP